MATNSVTSGHVATTPYQFSIFKASHTVSVVSITRSSTTATVTATGHGFRNGASVTIAGATQTDYNGAFTITLVDADTFTYTVANSPASPATGTITATGADQAVTNSTTLASDTELTLAVAAGTDWMVDFTVFYQNTDDTTDGIKVAVSAPSGAVGYMWTLSEAVTATKAIALGTAQAITSNSLDATVQVRRVRALVRNLTTAGSITLKFAQVTGAAAKSATVMAGSTMTATQLYTTMVV
jgi:hypothetical protein